MLSTSISPVPMGGTYIDPSLPWLISSLMILAVALSEEIAMTHKLDEEYLEYQRETPFMFPLPNPISSFVTIPIRFLFDGDAPKNNREIFYMFISYFGILILFSLPFFLLDYPKFGWWSWPYY
jgi:hypothetical protein